MEIKIFKKQKKFQKGGFHTNPNISWEIILCSALIIIIIFAIFGFFLFRKVSQKNNLPIISESKLIPKISADRLDKALNYFLKQEEKSAEILNSSAPVVDPSL